MKISSAFPSTYLKAADLQDRTVKVVMERVEIETVGDDHKPVLYFKGKERGLVLNKTNSNNLTFAFGDETDEWTGAEIELYPTMVDFQGRSVAAIRVRAIPPKRKKNAMQTRLYNDEDAERAKTNNDAQAGGAQMDDEIPF